MFRDRFFARLEEHLSMKVGDVSWWEQRGECLMSGTDTLELQNNNKLMILGLNPGGGKDGSELPPLKDQVRTFRERRGGPFSTYLDECWHYTKASSNFEGWPHKTCHRCEQFKKEVPGADGGATVLQERHQKYVHEIAKDLKVDLRKTVALNALWVQTPDAEGLARVARQFLVTVPEAKRTITTLFKQVYFPIIEHLIEGAGVRRVICLGNGRYQSAFGMLADALGVNVTQWGQHYRDGRTFEATKLRVFGIPHPSLHTLSKDGREKIQRWYEVEGPAVLECERQK